MANIINLIGQKFGRLSVIQKCDKNKQGNYRWLCLCDCGNEIIVVGGYLTSGKTKSCGCLWKESITKHGHSKNANERSITYNSWLSMVQRCTNHKHKYYKDYGGRGITVCKRWLKFKNFLEDMGERPKNKTLDRIDNNKNYYKKNCKWSTSKEQARNYGRNINFIHNNKKQCLMDWSLESGIKYGILYYRIFKLGLSITEALGE